MLAIIVMGNTGYFIFYAISLVAFVLAAVGFKPVGDRVHLVGVGLAAFIFPLFWDRMALL